MKVRCCRSASLSLIPVLALLLAPGCARRGAEQPPEPKATQTTDVPLPEWAPKNPSPEFLRAARVLKPLPPEVYAQAAEGDTAKEAFAVRYQRTFALTYQLFGALTDHQIGQFRAKRMISIPVKSLTPRQRAALDNWFELWRETMAGTGQGSEEYLNDYLVHLYKTGAREDLSNVAMEFDARGDIGVDLIFEMREPDGTLIDRCGIRFAGFD